MVFCNFVKRIHYSEKIQFFQSSYPYLKNKNALSPFYQFYNSKWFSEDPHPSTTAKNFLGIDTGHYGLYYTIFNHDSDKNKRKQHTHSLKYDYEQLAEGDYEQYRLFDNFTKFIILQVNQDIYNNINYLKTVSRDFLSTLSIVRPKFFVNTTRRFSTVAIRSHPQQLDATVYETSEINEEENFESNFLQTQSANIETIYARNDPTELNLIYPLYQSLKRNSLLFTSIQLYNMVLNSIAERNLDNEELTFEGIESRLTNLLTVYQDILAVSNGKIKPNEETYQVVLGELFRGTLQTIKLGNKSNCPQMEFNQSHMKSQEYAQIGIDLFLSISKMESMNLSTILPLLFTILNVHSNLITRDLFTKVLNLHKSFESDSGVYYVGLIGLSVYFSKLHFFQLKEEFYDFIFSVYESYKANSMHYEGLLSYEYDIYSILIQSLVKSDNFPLATKFLDDILLDYKGSLNSFKSPSISKRQVSNLLSVYLNSIIGQDYSRENLNKGYNLLMKFNEISYIPELSVTLYNNMINQFINQYHVLENEKYELAKTTPDKIEGVSELQATYYKAMWKLYDYMAIRKDYHASHEIDSMFLILNEKMYNCREYLLSLSIDLGDHEKVFQIIKEILLKNHLIQDLNVFKKLNNYLYNGSTNNGFNVYYFELMGSLIENQAVHYENDSQLLNHYMSEFINYLILQNNEYNVKILLNSAMINKAFSEFDLQSNSIYGVLQVSKFLIQYINSGIEKINESTLFKILHFQSSLINEFENTENHYILLDPEIIDFKELLKLNFIDTMKSYMTIPNFRISDDIAHACAIYDLELVSVNDHVPEKNEVELDYDLNLAFLLNVNYDSGISKFMDLFNAGYKFTYSTWKIVINQDFILNILEKNARISIDEFVNRILQQNFEVEEKTELLESVIKINNEKVNIHLLRNLLNNPFVINNQLLVTFMKFMTYNSNQYLSDIVNENFSQLIIINDNKEWINEYFKYLIKSNNYGQLSKIVEQGYPIHKLNLQSPTELEMIQAVLESLLGTRKFSEFNSLFKSYFNNPDASKILMSNTGLINLLIKYYTLNGSFGIILQKFKPAANRSTETKSLINFAEFMQTLDGSSRPIGVTTCTNLDDLAISLMKCESAPAMLGLYEESKKFNRDSLFASMIENYTKAAVINDSLNQPQKPLVNRFQKTLKFMQMIDTKRLSIGNLNEIIRFLAITRSVDNLSILANKVIDQDKVTDLVNFYFLEFLFTTPKDKLLILQSLKDAFTYLSDPINTYTINQFCQEQNIDLKTNDFEAELNTLAF